MTEGCMSQVMAHADRLNEVLVKTQRATDRAGDLRDFQRVRQARAVVIALRRYEDLCLVHQAPAALGVDDAVAVPLALGSHRRRLVRPFAPGALAARGAWSEDLVLPLFEPLTDG